MEESVNTDKFAIATLVLSVLAPVSLFLPLNELLKITLGISPLITLYIAITQIAGSEGRQKGTKLVIIGIVAYILGIVFVAFYMLLDVILHIAEG